jgi:glyoxylase-like metal-dependent hydrolase (beta-lactamase superfamily II)/rhodanese-related sulfurtransferase
LIFQQLLNEESGCLSYVIGCGQAGRAVIVDPGRDRVHDYLRIARKKGLTITDVVETHTHADHISGNRDLAGATGATIRIHRAAAAAFDHAPLADGDVLRLGTVELKVCHAPGHTPDSICLLVTDHARGAEPWFVLTGDTLFVGSVGRPDLGGARAAEDIFDSLRRVLLPLDDGIEVYPGHGAGSACGRAMSAKAASTIGFERRFNPALRYDDRAAFVEFLMEGVPPKPAAFETIVAKNRGLLPLSSAKPRPYAAREAWAAMQDGALMLDLRDAALYGEAHAAGALNVWIDSPQFAERVAGVVPAGARLLLTPSAPSDVERAVQALSRVGIDEVAGSLQWGMIDWRDAGLPVETVAQISVHELSTWLEQGQDVVVVDVREPLEWLEGHIANATHLPMFEAVPRVAELPADRPKAVVCAGGLRSSTTISALKRHLPGPWFNVTGGMGAWLKAGYGVRRPAPPPPRT